jgi:hypothetical protein
VEERSRVPVDDERDTEKVGEEEEEQSSQDRDDSDSSSADEDKPNDTPAPDADTDEDEDDEEFFDRERAQATIRNLRQKEKERNQFEKELKSVQKELRKREREGLSELEQLKSDNEEKDTELSTLRSQNETLRNRIERSSFIESIGYDGPVARHAWNALNDADVEPEFDDQYRLKNRKAVVKALKEYDPELFATGSADGGKRERMVEGEPDMNAIIRQGFGRSA